MIKIADSFFNLRQMFYENKYKNNLGFDALTCNRGSSG